MPTVDEATVRRGFCKHCRHCKDAAKTRVHYRQYFRKGKAILWYPPKEYQDKGYEAKYHRAKVLDFTENTENIVQSSIVLKVVGTQEVVTSPVLRLKLDFHEKLCVVPATLCMCIDRLNSYY